VSAIFVSHSSADRAFADELRDRLVAVGHRLLFLDYDPEHGIPAGREWERELYAQLRSCQGVVVLCSDWDGSRAPYPGMTAFAEADAPVFFGRDAEVQQGLDLLNRLRRFGGERLALVLGASGSGKSSLVRAGLLPRLRRDPDAWLPLPVARPRQLLASLGLPAEPACGADLVELVDGLRIAANRPEASVLLAIDQGEELLGRADLRTLLRDALHVPDSPLIALCTLRSDFPDGA
jgi:hypothetical protein